jgi:hypothetical protein
MASFLFLYWCLSGIVLWWSYDIGPLIRGAHYEKGQALRLVAGMALIITALTALAWWLAARHRSDIPTWRLMWGTAWRTGSLLVLYGAVVLAWMQFSHSGVPMNSSAFVPILGRINSHFFSDAGWLSYLLTVTPIMGCLSGVLYYLQTRLSSPSNTVGA